MEKTLDDLFKTVVGGSNVSNLIKNKTEVEIGHIGEAIVRMAVALHIDPKDPESRVTGLVYIPGNRFDDIHIESYLASSNIANSCETGAIDAAWNTGDVYHLCSSKFGKKTITALTDLDISRITQEIYKETITHNGNIVRMNNVVYYVIVRNKRDVIDILNKNRYNAVKLDLKTDNVLDIDDLDRICFKIQDIARGSEYPRKEFLNPKNFLSLRFHQELIYRMGVRAFKNGSSKILIGALPRSGKTFIGAKLCVGYSKILVLTTRPSETRSSWNKVFLESRDFENYTVRNMSSEMEDVVISENTVMIASTQFYKCGDRRSVRGTAWDLILVDEVHEGGCTARSKEIMDNNSNESTRFVLMTATYAKPILEFNLSTDECFFWDLEDIRLMKNWSTASIERLREKYGDIVLQVVYDFVIKKRDVCGIYKAFPNPYLLTTVMHQAYYAKLVDLMDNPTNVYGFSMRSLLMTTEDDLNFQHPRAVDKFLALISGSNMEEDYPRGDMSMLTRIERIQMMEQHSRGDMSFLTMQWFLPYGVGQKVEGVKNCLIKHIKRNPVLRDFEVMTFESGNHQLPKDVRDSVILAKSRGKCGLIILTGDVGSLGVSIPEIDATFLMHDFESSDKTFQQLTRCLTEDYANGKRVGVIVDFNVWRVLNTLSDYAVGRCGRTFKDTTDKITWCVSNLITVDCDLWKCRETGTTVTESAVIEALTNEWTKMLKSAGYSLAALGNKFADIGKYQAVLNNLIKHIDKTKHTKPEKKDKMEDGLSVLSDGLVSDDESGKPESDEETTVVKNVNLYEIIERLAPEMIILTGGKMNMVDSFNYIGSKPDLRVAMNMFIHELCGA
jgi:superfamily II DNA or RNA helicase